MWSTVLFFFFFYRKYYYVKCTLKVILRFWKCWKLVIGYIVPRNFINSAESNHTVLQEPCSIWISTQITDFAQDQCVNVSNVPLSQTFFKKWLHWLKWTHLSSARISAEQNGSHEKQWAAGDAHGACSCSSQRYRQNNTHCWSADFLPKKSTVCCTGV